MDSAAYQKGKSIVDEFVRRLEEINKKQGITSALPLGSTGVDGDSSDIEYVYKDQLEEGDDEEGREEFLGQEDFTAALRSFIIANCERLNQVTIEAVGGQDETPRELSLNLEIEYIKESAIISFPCLVKIVDATSKTSANWKEVGTQEYLIGMDLNTGEVHIATPEDVGDRINKDKT